MKFKYLSCVYGSDFQLRTITARDEYEAWKIIEDNCHNWENGILVPIEEWDKLISGDKNESQRID